LSFKPFAKQLEILD